MIDVLVIRLKDDVEKDEFSHGVEYYALTYDNRNKFIIEPSDTEHIVVCSRDFIDELFIITEEGKLDKLNISDEIEDKLKDLFNDWKVCLDF